MRCDSTNSVRPMSHLTVLYEDNHLLVVDKPAGLPTMGVADGRETLLERAKEYVKLKYAKPGNVYLGVVSRLDAPVTGVVILARTSKAASRLSRQFRERTVEKSYAAVVSGVPRPAAGRLVDFLRHDERHRRVRIVSADDSEAARAELEYTTRRSLALGTQLDVRLLTGRKHQIRVQLSGLGHPVIGDRKYGSREPFSAGIALHARQLVFRHPVRDQELTIQAPLPRSWRELE